MTVKEAAEYLDIDESLVRRYIRNGKLEAQKAGARVYVIETEIVKQFKDDHPRRAKNK